MGEQFFLTLPSNSSQHYYGRQTPGHYRTRLAVPLHLDPATYEVGVTDVSLPAATYNVPTFSVTRHGVWRSKDAVLDQYTFHVERGYYKSVEHFLTILNRASVDAVDPSEELARENTFLYDRESGRATCTVGEGYRVTFDDVLGVVLGFGDSKTFSLGGGGESVYSPELTHFKGNSVTAMAEANVNRLQESLTLYTDIVVPQRVGEHTQPILRHLADMTAGAEEETDVVGDCFEHVHYIPLQRACIESIDIYYADVTGREPTYLSGSSLCKLHIRRKR